jgi:ribonuclease VapC
MIVDSSALIAILKREPEGSAFSGTLEAAPDAKISAATYLEAAIVIDRLRDPMLSLLLDDVIERARISIEPLTAAQAKIARQAYRDYGKGSGHPAKFSYALARDKREPLLYKGDDFVHTDLRPA